VTGTRVSLVVRDTGVGIAPEVLRTCSNGSIKVMVGRAGPAGRGWGWPSPTRSSPDNGGTIAVESRPGQGSAFAISLPQYVDRPGSDFT